MQIDDASPTPLSTFYFVIFAANADRRLDLLVEARDAAQARRFWTRWRDANRHARATEGPLVFRVPRTTGRLRVLQWGVDIATDMPASPKTSHGETWFEVVEYPGDARRAFVVCRGPVPEWFTARGALSRREAEERAARLNRAVDLNKGKA